MWKMLIFLNLKISVIVVNNGVVSELPSKE